MFLIGTYSFSDEVFLSGGLAFTPETQITGFYSRTLKLQPAAEAESFFYINFNDFIKAGLSGGFLYAFSSDINGGWSYPGFSGIETGAEIRAVMPFLHSIELGVGADAGWYRYSLTENFFFLPSVTLSPAFKLYGNELTDLYVELPFKYYFHKQADIFLSAGLKFRAVFK